MSPYRIKHDCRYPHCRQKTSESYCAEHKKIYAKQWDTNRGTSVERGYDARWRKESKLYLAENPLCEDCLKRGELVTATLVHHIVDHKGNEELFWDRENNWRALCGWCHNRIKDH